MDASKIEKYLELIIQYGIEYGIKVLAAIAIFIIGKWVVNKISSFIGKLMERGDIDATLSAFIMSVVNILLMLIVILAAVS